MNDERAAEAHRWPAALGFVILALAASAPGILFPPGPWYAALTKPSWNPPGWVFGPVWTTLYILMGVAAYLVWRARGWDRELVWWSVQLGLNAAWTPLFFGLRRPDLAFVEICALWFAIAVTLTQFLRVHRAAGLLLVPYLAWVSFAAVLNATLWSLN